MGVEVATFTRSTPYVPWAGGPLRLFSCGRLNPCKGHADTIRAVRLLAARGMDARLAIAGEDEQGGTGYRRNLDRLVRSEGLAGRVELLGAVGEGEIVHHLDRAHFFVLASTAEPLGVAIMEAMSMAVPVVATAAGGVPELVEDGIDGILVAPGHPEAIAARIEELARDSERTQRLGQAARHKVVRHFDASRGGEVLARLLTAFRPEDGGVRASTS
jgi:glycosyltransferase involved in cell wall biosynthesis